MHYSTFKFALDLQVVQSQVSIPVKFGDTAVRLIITLTDGGVPFTLTEGFLAVLSGVKSDGNKLFNNCMIDLKNSAIIYDFTEQTTTSEGITQCEIILYNPEGKVLGTPRFIMLVDNRLVYNNDIVSEEENTAIDDMIIEGNETIAKVNEAMDGMMSGTKGLQFTLNEDGKSYSVTGYSGNIPNLYIAPTHKGLPVTHIADAAFAGNSSIKTVSLPKGLTHIGHAAFAATGIVQINIPKSIEYIGDYAFDSTALKSIAIREDVAEDDLVLSDHTFASCYGLEDIYLSWDKDSGSDTNPPWGATNATVHYGVRPATTLDINEVSNRITEEATARAEADTALGNRITELTNNTYSKEAVDGYIDDAKKYADNKVTSLINGAPETLDTLGELSDALKDNADIVDVLNGAIGNKLNKIPFTSADKGKTVKVGDRGELFAENEFIPDVVQTTGDSETMVISQAAVTNEFDLIRAKETVIRNLFNKDDPDIISGKIIGMGDTTFDAAWYHITGYIPVKEGETYIFPVTKSSYGWTTSGYVLAYNTSKTYIKELYGSISGDFMTLTIDDADVAYVKTNVLSSNTAYGLSNFMFVNSDTYPSEYIPYTDTEASGDITLNPNVKIPFNSLSALHSPLQGKKIVFTGDSICAGLSDETGVRGWAQRIGEKYSMDWTNAAISGGTITNKTTLPTSPFCIAETNFGENPDYIILEGGTNDADLIGCQKDDTENYLKDEDGYLIPNTSHGTISKVNYELSPFTTDTFCGAVEHLFKRVITDYAGAKIGFIIAPKMGGWSGGGYNYTAENSVRRRYFETIITLCKKWGIPYLDLWNGCYLNPSISAHNSGDNPFYSNADMQHLTARGYNYITPMIEKWMETL